jgi:exodeoxyribonuclease V gamma subunit
MAGDGHLLPGFIIDELPGPADTGKTVDINDLINFFSNPAKFLLQTRLGVYQEREEALSDDRENFKLAGLDRYLMEQDLLEKRIEGEENKTLHLFARARGMLPHGTVGETICNKTIADISVFVKYLLSYLFTEKKEQVSFDIPIGEFALKGRIENVYSRHSLIYRYAYLRPRDFLRLWIEHLSLGSFHGCIPEESFLIGLNDKTRLPCAWKFRAAENVDEILEDLIKIFYEGLQRPVPFFPASSLLFAEAVMDEKPEEYGLQKARQKLFGNEYSSGEINDLYMSRCFGKNYEPDEQFIRYSHRVYDPLLKNLEEVKSE